MPCHSVPVRAAGHRWRKSPGMGDMAGQFGPVYGTGRGCWSLLYPPPLPVSGFLDTAESVPYIIGALGAFGVWPDVHTHTVQTLCRASGNIRAHSKRHGMALPKACYQRLTTKGVLPKMWRQRRTARRHTARGDLP